MKQPCVVAVIMKDAVEHLPVVVPVHEVPVLIAVHGEDRVTIDESADLPKGADVFEFEPEDEFARLEQRYGINGDTKRSYVSMAYESRSGFLARMKELSAEQDEPATGEQPPQSRRRAGQTG